jgi:Leucine-rich repeat (LRR) protein
MQHTRKFSQSFFLVLLALLSVFGAYAQVPELQRQALVDLYNATGGTNWNNNSNWPDNDPCADAWYGVGCDGDDNIIALQLPANRLDDQIPASISQLSFLETLDISENFLPADTPEIGQISTLKHLNLASTYWDAFPNSEFPQWVLQLSQLEYLNLFGNNIIDELPAGLGNLTSLRELNLSANRLQGVIPQQLSQLVELRILEIFNVNGNDLTGQFPTWITQLSHLEVLKIGISDWDADDLGPVPADIGSLNQLHTLWLVGPFTGILPPSLSQLSQLKNLYIESEYMQEQAFPGNLLQLSGLEHLTLSANLTGTIPDNLTDLTALVTLGLADNQLEGPIPGSLGQLSELTAISLRFNNLTGGIPLELSQISGLWFLDLEHNQLSGQYPAWFHTSDSLNTVNIRNNAIRGVIRDAYFQQRYIDLFADFNALQVESEFLLDDFDFNCYCDWRATQTTPPDNLSITQLDNNHALLTWDPIGFDFMDGGYQVWLKTQNESTFQLHQVIRSKSVASAVIGGLEVGQAYEVALGAYSHLNVRMRGLKPLTIYAPLTESLGFQQSAMTSPTTDLRVELEGVSTEIDGTVLNYTFLISNVSGDAQSQAALAVFGHNPPYNEFPYAGFGVSCLDSSAGVTCPQINSFDYNFHQQLDLPQGSWYRFRVGWSANLVIADEDLPYHVVQVLPSMGWSDEHYADNQLDIRLHDHIFEQNFED